MKYRIDKTGLMESLAVWNSFLGALNYYDLIISKLFRGTSVDMEDCLSLYKNRNKEIDRTILKERFYKTSSFDVSEERVNKNLIYFLELIKNK